MADGTRSVHDIIATMGGAQKTLLRSLPVPWSEAHPSTREALITRGLANHVAVYERPIQFDLTPTGLIVRDVLEEADRG